MKITSQFVNVNGKNFFYRVAGKGAAVIVIHQSPQSSSASIDWINSLANKFLVIGPDTPGYGYSEPLTIQNPNIEDFAQAILDFCESLGLSEFALIGTHTGAAIAGKMCEIAPTKVTAAVFDGFPVFNAAERQLLGERYLPPFEPKWDGSHLAWLWSRIREQTIFFPWYESDSAHRMEYDCRGPEGMNQWAIDFLMAGENYCKAYKAAFQQNGVFTASRVTTPALFYYFKSDPLSTHANRLSFQSKSQQLQLIDTSTDHFELVKHFLIQQLDSRTAASIRKDNISKNGSLELLPIDSKQQIAIARVDNQSDRTRIWLHDFTHNHKSSLERLEQLTTTEAIAQLEENKYNEILIDLPAHGLTELTELQMEPHSFARILLMQLDQAPSTIIAEGASLNYGLAISNQCDDCNVIGVNAYLIDQQTANDWIENALPALTPEWNGAYLQSAWQASRLSRLFWPWYKTDKAHIVPGEPNLSPNSIANQTLNWLTCHGQFETFIKTNMFDQSDDKSYAQTELIYSEGHPAISHCPANFAKREVTSSEIWQVIWRI